MKLRKPWQRYNILRLTAKNTTQPIASIFSRRKKAYRKAHPEIERNKYNRKKDDPIFKEKRRIKNARTCQRRKERLAAEKAAAQAPEAPSDSGPKGSNMGY